MVKQRSPVTRFSDVFTLRMPDGMRDEIAAKAAENGRSANTEIVLRLQESLSSGDNPELAAIREHFDRRIDEVIALIQAKE